MGDGKRGRRGRPYRAIEYPCVADSSEDGLVSAIRECVQQKGTSTLVHGGDDVVDIPLEVKWPTTARKLEMAVAYTMRTNKRNGRRLPKGQSIREEGGEAERAMILLGVVHTPEVYCCVARKALKSDLVWSWTQERKASRPTSMHFCILPWSNSKSPIGMGAEGTTSRISIFL